MKRILFVFLCMFCLTASAYEVVKYNVTVDGFTYNIVRLPDSSLGASLQDVPEGTGSDGELAIPNGLTYMDEWIPVKILGSLQGADRDAVESIILPSSLLEIKDVMNFPRLRAVELPDGLKEIWSYAFSGCSSLTSLVIPRSVRQIGDGFLCGCTSLASIEVEEGNEIYCSLDGHAIVNRKNGVLLVDISGTVIPESVTGIGACAFWGREDLTEIALPEHVTSIGAYAFYGCTNLRSVSIPKAVTSLESNTFNGCKNLMSVLLPEGLTSIGESAFAGSGITAIELPASVKTIKDNAFHNCQGLTSVVIPASVLAVGEGAFSSCSSLRSAELLCPIASTGRSLFQGCSSLTRVVLPESLTAIGDQTFWGCQSLASIHLPELVKEIGGYAFAETGISDFFVPEGITVIYPGAFCNCENLRNISFPESLKQMMYDAFKGCSSLRSVVLPRSMEQIGLEAFWDCASLEQVWSLSPVPFTLRESFNAQSEMLPVLYVPMGSREAYAASNWSQCFARIEEFDATAIQDLPAPSPDAPSVNGRCFDLTGRPLSTTPMQRGIYIRDGKKVGVK